jgi:hypothetical protein
MKHLEETTMNRPLINALFIAALLIPATALPSSLAEPSGPLEVRVNNFPDMQQVKGSVSIDGVIRHSQFVEREGLVVPTSRRSEVSEMIQGGIVETDGYTSMTISLQGEFRSPTFMSGTIGVLLIPDEKPVGRSLREGKIIQFGLESAAKVTSGAPSFFSADQVQLRVGFPRYRMYLYNTSDKTVEANVYLYLSN